MTSVVNQTIRRAERENWRIFQAQLCSIKKWANPGLFRTFQTKKTILMWKILCPSSIRRQYLNPQPHEHESSPITTRPGLAPFLLYNLCDVSRFATQIRKQNCIRVATLLSVSIQSSHSSPERKLPCYHFSLFSLFSFHFLPPVTSSN